MSAYIYITPFFPSPECWHGAYCYDFVMALQKIYSNVVVFLPDPGDDYDYRGIHVYRFKALHLPFGLFPFLMAKVNRHRFLRKLASIGISALDIAVCHANTSEYAIYANAIKDCNPSCRTFLHHHNCEPIRLNAGRLGNIMGYSDLMYHWQRKNCERIDLHIFCSEKSRDTYGLYAPNDPESEWCDIRRKCLFGKFHRPLSKPKSIVLYNGVDETLFRPAVPQEHRTEQFFTIGCIGNFQPLKGHLILLQAINKIKDDIPNLRLRLLGSGEMMPVCQRFVTGHGLSDVVSFETEVDHTQLPDFYYSLDLFVLPSRLEGFGCVYIEAHVCGVPFVGCRGIGCSEVLPPEERDLWLAEPNNADSLAEKILNYYHNRPSQHLTRSMAWDGLVREYIEKIKENIYD